MIYLNATFDDNVTAATGTAVQQFAAIVEEKLCSPVCQNQGLQPISSVTYSLANQTQNGTTTFVDLVAEGTINYVPKGASGCCVRPMQFMEKTTLAFYNASATNPVPAITLVQGASEGSLADLHCNTAKAYQIATLVTVSATWS